MTRAPPVVSPILALALAGALALAPTASALYMVTPLTLSFSTENPQAGDAVTITFGPNAEHENGTAYAGDDIRVRYSWDPNERAEGEEDPDAPTSSEEQVEGDAGTVRLDDASQGSLTWTVPPEADDHNVFFQALAEDDTLLASGHLPVGDAPPIMTIMAGSGPAGPAVENDEPTPGEPTDAPAVEGEDGTAGDDPAGDDAAGDNAVPLPGALLVVAAIAGVALLARRR